MTPYPSAHSPRPLFSIVLPKRNRSDVVGYALQRALDQTIDDYENIVSDNTSADEIPQVLEMWTDPRIWHIRTAQALTQVDS